jgi:hypothetical protein
MRVPIKCSETAKSTAAYSRLASSGREPERLVHKGQIPHERVVDLLDAAAVLLHVVSTPADAELLASRGQLADRVWYSPARLQGRRLSL